MATLSRILQAYQLGKCFRDWKWCVVNELALLYMPRIILTKNLSNDWAADACCPVTQSFKIQMPVKASYLCMIFNVSRYHRAWSGSSRYFMIFERYVFNVLFAGKCFSIKYFPSSFMFDYIMKNWVLKFPVLRKSRK